MRVGANSKAKRPESVAEVDRSSRRDLATDTLLSDTAAVCKVCLKSPGTPIPKPAAPTSVPGLLRQTLVRYRVF